MNLINVLNIVIIVLMLVPNIIYTIKAKNFKNRTLRRQFFERGWSIYRDIRRSSRKSGRSS